VDEESSRCHTIGMLLSKTGVAVAMSVLTIVPFSGFLLHISGGWLIFQVAIIFYPPFIVFVIWFCSRWHPPFRTVWCILLAIASVCSGYATTALAIDLMELDRHITALSFYLVPASAALGTWAGPTLLNLTFLCLRRRLKPDSPSYTHLQSR
jgi:hypothetical protein